MRNIRNGGRITITDKLTIAGLEWYRSQEGMAATGPWSLYWSREGGRRGWQSSNKMEKRSCEKKSQWWRKKQKGGENSQPSPSAGNSQEGMAATGPWSLYWLREGGRRSWIKSNSIGKSCCEKKIGMVRGKIEMRRKLTITASSIKLTNRQLRRWDLIPLVNWGRASHAIDRITI